MLELVIPESELFDESSGEFITVRKAQTIRLEHSLVSLSKWESKWHKPFLSETTPKTTEERIDYLRCMTITQNVSPDVYAEIWNTPKLRQEVLDYLDEPMTATTISRRGGRRPNREVVTAEIIYHWMITWGIPFECQKWHLNRLMMLIDVCSVKSGKPEKMSQAEVIRQNRMLNEARRKKYKTRG